MQSLGQTRCEGTDCGDNDKGERYKGFCDKDGADINPYRLGQHDFFGPGSQVHHANRQRQSATYRSILQHTAAYCSIEPT